MDDVIEKKGENKKLREKQRDRQTKNRQREKERQTYIEREKEIGSVRRSDTQKDKGRQKKYRESDRHQDKDKLNFDKKLLLEQQKSQALLSVFLEMFIVETFIFPMSMFLAWLTNINRSP